MCDVHTCVYAIKRYSLFMAPSSRAVSRNNLHQMGIYAVFPLCVRSCTCPTANTVTKQVASQGVSGHLYASGVSPATALSQSLSPTPCSTTPENEKLHHLRTAWSLCPQPELTYTLSHLKVLL